MIGRNLALEAVRATERAALLTAEWIGKGSSHDADQAAVNGMREALNAIHMEGVIVIGEGERDQAPMLYIGERVGTGEGPQVDLALDPLEGTTICANGMYNSLSVLAITNKGGFLNAPDVYMNKIAVGHDVPEDAISLNFSVKENLQNIAEAKKKSLSNISVVILDRPRHEEMIAYARELGCRINLIPDGDVIGAMSVSMGHSPIDCYMGIGGAPEGVLAAAALSCLGGVMYGKLIFDSDIQRERAYSMGIKDLNRIYNISDMASGDVMFAATGVTDGSLLKGIRQVGNKIHTSSVVMRSKTGTIRYIDAEHTTKIIHAL